jgi:hypothetical protein
MRAKEFYFEASIFSRPGRYVFGHKVRVGLNSQKGKAFFQLIKQELPDFEPTEDLEWIDSPGETSEGIPTIVLSKNGERKFFKRPNGQVISVISLDKPLEQSLTHAPGQKGSTAENKGDLSEPILSAAVVAKLINRGSSNIQDITEEDLKNVLLQTANSDQKEFVVNDKNSRIADVIKFTLAIRGPALEFLKSDMFWSKAGKLISAATHYANSGQIDRYADYFYKNGKVDMISVASDGLSDQRSRKTDIEAYASDEDGNIRKLKNLSISLKAGSDTIGQIGGGITKDPFKVSKGGGGVWTNANRLFGPLGITISKPSKVEDRSQFWKEAYTEAARELKKKLSGSDAKKEAGIIDKIADLITTHGTLNDPTVKLVSLDAKQGISSVVSFANLSQRLKDERINLDSSLEMGSSKTKNDPRPSIVIFDKNTNSKFLVIRFSSTEDGIKSWNSIELMPPLKKLISIAYKKKPEQQPASPATQTQPVQQPNTATQTQPVQQPNTATQTQPVQQQAM